MKTSKDLAIEQQEREALDEQHQEKINAHARTEYIRDIKEQPKKKEESNPK